MTTYSALTTLPDKETAIALEQALETLDPAPYGVGVFEMEDGSLLWEVGAYFTDKPDIASLEILTALYKVKSFVVSEIPPTDWVAHVKRELAPVEAGRFFVYGSHDADKVPANKTPLLIEAAMAFGTGHHGTTLGCLRALDRLLSEGFMPRNAIDVGCGTAVLAMAAAHETQLTVWASDNDPVAIDVAKSNAQANGLSALIKSCIAEGLEHPHLQSAAPFDLIFANILKGPLQSLAPSFAKATDESSIIILSGILNEQAEDVIGTYQEYGFILQEHDQIAEWSTLTLRKS